MLLEETDSNVAAKTHRDLKLQSGNGRIHVQDCHNMTPKGPTAFILGLREINVTEYAALWGACWPQLAAVFGLKGAPPTQDAQ